MESGSDRHTEWHYLSCTVFPVTRSGCAPGGPHKDVKMTESLGVKTILLFRLGLTRYCPVYSVGPGRAGSGGRRVGYWRVSTYLLESTLLDSNWVQSSWSVGCVWVLTVFQLFGSKIANAPESTLRWLDVSQHILFFTKVYSSLLRFNWTKFFQFGQKREVLKSLENYV